MIAYCDTSFILEYWEAYVFNENSPIIELEKKNRPKYLDFVKSLLRSEKKHEGLKPIRRLIDNFEIEPNLVSSFLALTEIYEKFAEWGFKNIISESTGIDRVFNKGKKEIGDLITKTYHDKSEEAETIFKSLIPNHFEESTFGIVFKDVENLNLPINEFKQLYSLLSILQIGTTDILHLMSASNLKATHFLTFDNDFVRAKDIIKDNLNIEVVYTVDSMNKLLKNKR